MNVLFCRQETARGLLLVASGKYALTTSEWHVEGCRLKQLLCYCATRPQAAHQRGDLPLVTAAGRTGEMRSLKGRDATTTGLARGSIGGGDGGGSTTGGGDGVGGGGGEL